MKLLRYKKPSVRSLMGVTKVKRRIKRATGISQIQGWTKPARIKQKVKNRAGFYSTPVRIVRQASKGKVPTLLGLFTKKDK